MAVDPAVLRDFASELGIRTEYYGSDGSFNSVPHETLHAVVGSFGYPVETNQDVDEARAARTHAYWQQTLPPVTVTRDDRDITIPVHVPHGTSVHVDVRFEDGGGQALTQVEDNTPPFDTGAEVVGQARFLLPAGLPLGWHTLVAHTEKGEAHAQVVVTPARLTTSDVVSRRRGVGVHAQLYSVRSERSWGLGDIADLRDLSAILGARYNADFVQINPLHATAPAPPVEASPYLPSSRRFFAALYVLVEDIPEFAQAPESVRQRVRDLHQQFASVNRLNTLLDRNRVLTAKLEALELLFAVPRTPARKALFDAYRRAEGSGLSEFAQWCADEAQGRRPESAVMADPEFHAWVQWIIDEQLMHAQSAATAAGMRIGIMHDLAVGVEQNGADAWMHRNVLAEGVSVGAPADQYNEHGQDWSQSPWHPERMVQHCYRPWRDMLRTLMRHAGGLRVDHILGLFRLWWIPRGNTALNGAYVTYDHEALVGILALEAQRSGTVVVGEDLGTFEPWIQDYLQERGVLGTSVLWFERDGGTPRAPQHYRRACLATVNTHDLAPVRGYVDCSHVKVREQLGLLTRSAHEELANENQAIDAVVEVATEVGCYGPDGADDTDDLVVGLHRYIARTPAVLVAAGLADCVGERRMQNQPGTSTEYPNWKLPLADSKGRVVLVDDLAGQPLLGRIMDALSE